MNEKDLEALVKEKGLAAPRITPKHIDACIETEAYYVFPGTAVTVCCLGLVNGFSTIGHSACADIENFDADVGAQLAFDDARKKIWLLEGYLLRENLHKSDMAKASSYAVGN